MANGNNGNPAQVIAATDGLGDGGQIVYASISGAIDMRDLEPAWKAAGLDEKLLPSQPTEKNALKRALKSVKNGERELLRPLPREEGFALVRERATDDEDAPLEYETETALVGRVVRKGTGSTAVRVPEIKPADEDRVPTILAHYEENLNLVAGAYVGHWLWHTLAPTCKAVCLRPDAGGFLYIPPEFVETWNQYADVVRAVSAVQLFEIPAMRSEGAVEAILHAITAEARAEVKRMADDLRDDEKSLGKRALATKGKATQDIREKVRYYEKLCATALPELQAQIDELDADVAAAVLLLDASDDDDE